MRDANLRIAHEELKSIAANLELFRKAISEDNVPHPPFDSNGWTLLSQASVLATMQPKTAEALMNAYNRVRSANVQMEEVADITTGRTAAVVHASVAQAVTRRGNLLPLADQMYAQYQQRRADLREASLAARLSDLRQHVDEAIDAVESGVGEPLSVPSAQRKLHWLRADPRPGQVARRVAPGARDRAAGDPTGCSEAENALPETGAAQAHWPLRKLDDCRAALVCDRICGPTGTHPSPCEGRP